MQDFKHIEKLHSDYRYMVQDNPDIQIIYGIASAVNAPDGNQDSFDLLWNAKSTEHFINPRGYIPLICKELGIPVPQKYASITEAPSYASPGYNMVTINGSQYDAQMDAVRIANKLLGTPPFKTAVEAIADINYRNYLKVLHAINSFDLEYGISAASEILEGEKQDLNTLVLIINLLEAKQRTQLDDNITESELFKKISQALQGTIWSLNLLAIKKLTSPELEFLKELKSTKDLLYKSHPQTAVDEHWKSIAKI